MQVSPSLRLLSAALGGLLVAACSGGGGSSASGSVTPPASSTFGVDEVSVENNAIWELNRPIEITFTDPIDFSTVSPNTINIQSTGGVPATGTYYLKPTPSGGVDPRTVVFQPTCPTRPDLSDAGLRPGGIQYVLKVIGLSSGAQNTVRSTGGSLVRNTQIRVFSTPASISPSIAFTDTAVGPPVPVVRPKSSTAQSGVTYIEVGGDPDPDTHLYFEFDASTQTYAVVPGPKATSDEAPLNLYSEAGSKVAVFIEFNQAVNPSSTNISPQRLRLEFKDLGGAWQPLETRVEIVANCTRVGATVKLEPVGLLPAGSQFRAVVRAGFADIVGEANLLPLTRFAEANTLTLAYATLTPANDGADEFVEQFLFGGNHPESFQDTEALLESPQAEWEDGKLTAAFSFEFDETQAPTDFDWIIKDGDRFIFDTTSTEIVGGENGIPEFLQQTKNGVVFVRNLIVEQGGTLKVQGPNPMQLNALGDVRIYGRVELGGFAAKDVATLNTGNQPEVGGAGVAGGGAGGRASEVTNSSTPCGGSGQGPFGERDTGGGGGESAYAPEGMGKEARRPGGGGGGRFGPDEDNPFGHQEAETGRPGHQNSTGAKSRTARAQGGPPGLGPFVDGDSTNDFFGTKPVTDANNNLVDLIRGELTSVWAGYGGGGGGDALPSNRFPSPRWNPGRDEKGGGGGGGAGALRIRSLGKIVFGINGRIAADGARGATGENTIFLDHIGGTGGAGSGGHVILESATQIDFTDEGANRDVDRITKWIDAEGGPLYIGSLNPSGSEIPIGISHGAPGGPGVVQFHVPDPTAPPSDDYLADADIIVPTAFKNRIVQNFQNETIILNHPLEAVSSPTPHTMLPTFGARSQARSKWISIGGADEKSGGGAEPLRFLFEGTVKSGVDEGKIQRASVQGTPLPAVRDVTPILGLGAGDPPLTAAPVPAPPDVTVLDGTTLVLSGEAIERRQAGGGTPGFAQDPGAAGAAGAAAAEGVLADDIYLRTPAILTNYVVRLTKQGASNTKRDFTVLSATYDDAAGVLAMTVHNDLGTLQEYIDAQGPVDYSVIPRFFRVITDRVPDLLPLDASVRIGFQATGADAFGRPDENNILVPPGGGFFVGDIGSFGQLDPRQLKFFRFEVVFDLVDRPGAKLSVDTKPVSLEFLKIPFRF